MKDRDAGLSSFLDERRRTKDERQRFGLSSFVFRPSSDSQQRAEQPGQVFGGALWQAALLPGCQVEQP